MTQALQRCACASGTLCFPVLWVGNLVGTSDWAASNEGARGDKAGKKGLSAPSLCC